jgi:hypothetical protein
MEIDDQLAIGVLAEGVVIARGFELQLNFPEGGRRHLEDRVGAGHVPADRMRLTPTDLQGHFSGVNDGGHAFTSLLAK